MAKNMQPIAKRCHALGISPAVMGYAKKTTNRNPGGQMRKKKSEYSLQLAEKQKVKFVYGIMERQFRSYYEKASRMAGKTGENLLILVERRLDNVVYRLGFASAACRGFPFIHAYCRSPTPPAFFRPGMHGHRMLHSIWDGEKLVTYTGGAGIFIEVAHPLVSSRIFGKGRIHSRGVVHCANRLLFFQRSHLPGSSSGCRS